MDAKLAPLPPANYYDYYFSKCIKFQGCIKETDHFIFCYFKFGLKGLDAFFNWTQKIVTVRQTYARRLIEQRCHS